MTTFPQTLPGDRVDVKLWAPINEVEEGALQQLKGLTSLPWVYHHVVACADVHVGKGCTVGSVIAMKDALSPAAIGVDISCGMSAVKTSLRASQLPENLEPLRSDIEFVIPMGFNSHKNAVFDSRNLKQFDARLCLDTINHLAEFHTLDKCVQDLSLRAAHQLGTLGGGNHFIEICLDDQPDPQVWLMLHSGSRNIGKELAEIHIAKARTLAHNQDLPDPDMAVFLSGTKEMQAYRHDLEWAQVYADLNRRTMMALLQQIMTAEFPEIQYKEQINCRHNYVAEETHFGKQVLVTRKGAVNAELGRLAIIPGSMGASSYIVRGLGNPESFNSASHGAGRKMSRGAARRHFTTQDLEAQTAGVCCRKDSEVLDEIPGAYKDIESVMQNQSNLVTIVAKLKQVLCCKG